MSNIQNQGNNKLSSSVVSDETRASLKKAFSAFENRNFELVYNIATTILRADPKVAKAHYLVGRVALETQQMNIAIKALAAATNLDNSEVDYWVYLGLVQYQTGDLVNTALSVEKALAIECTNATTLYTCAYLLSALGEHECATTYLNKAIAKQPQNAIFHRSLGLSLIEQGDFIEAKNSLGKAVELNPNDAEAWFLLSTIEKAKDNKNSSHTISLAKYQNVNSRDKSFLYYAAGKWHEDIGAWSEAFKSFDAGAKAKRKIVQYNELEAKAMFARIKKVCNKDWLNTSLSQNRDLAPIFIVGQPRTGTTLIERILSSHSMVSSAGEPLQLPVSLRQLANHRGTPFISTDLFEKASSINGDALASSYLSGLGKLRGDKPYFIDKLPMNFMLIGFIVKAFPNAKIIHVTRGAADTCFAVFKQLFEDVYEHSYSLIEMANHYVMYRDLMAHWHHIMPDKIYDIAYEDVVHNTDTESRGLIKHVGLEWEDACANFQQNEAASVTASAFQVRQKIHSGSIGRWKQYQKELQPVLSILKNAGIEP